MILASHTVGAGNSVTFLHGFTQTRASWDNITPLVPFACTCIDMPGHGESDHAQRSLIEIADDVAETMSHGVLIGYSMGARIALHTALQHPEKVQSLVLISGTAGIEDEDERKLRRESDHSLAAHIEETGITQFIDEWISQPIFAGLTVVNNQKQDRLTNTPKGLADSLRYAGTGTQISLWNKLGDLKMPVLLICGEKDTKFVQLAQRMQKLIPTAQLVIIANAGHTVHIENQDDFITALNNFLR